MASHRFCLTTLGDCAPSYVVTLIMDMVRYQQYRLDEGREAIIQLIRPAGGAVNDSANPQRNFLSEELIYQFRLSRANPLAELNTNDAGLSALILGVTPFYVVLFGARGTVVSGRVETN